MRWSFKHTLGGCIILVLAFFCSNAHAEDLLFNDYNPHPTCNNVCLYYTRYSQQDPFNRDYQSNISKAKRLVRASLLQMLIDQVTKPNPLKVHESQYEYREEKRWKFNVRASDTRIRVRIRYNF